MTQKDLPCVLQFYHAWTDDHTYEESDTICICEGYGVLLSRGYDGDAAAGLMLSEAITPSWITHNYRTRTDIIMTADELLSRYAYTVLYRCKFTNTNMDRAEFSGAMRHIEMAMELEAASAKP